ncbi:MAG TPA: hypothetical protein VHZ52_17400 [Acidobacteriaceae bacterium]|jgi:hypothetical protein|nr:hypothetical protein [Acidobacteriaceae bacterium]
MGKPPVAGRAASRPPRVAGHTASDPRGSADLSSKPLGSYQLTPLNLTDSLRSRIHLLSPEDALHLDPIVWAAPRLRLEIPYPDFAHTSGFKLAMDPPDSQTLSPREVLQCINDKSEGVRCGLDLSLDPGTFSLSVVARDWNLKTFRRGAFLADVLHEPTASVQLSFNPPGSYNPLAGPTGYGPMAAGISVTALNLHFQRNGEEFFELAFAQLGVQVDANGRMGFPLSVQGELHDIFAPNLSLTISAGGSLAQQDDKKFHLSWTPPVVGLLWHWGNP